MPKHAVYVYHGIDKYGSAIIRIHYWNAPPHHTKQLTFWFCSKCMGVVVNTPFSLLHVYKLHQ